MKPFQGETLSWEVIDGTLEVALHRDPCNEIGSVTLLDLERLAERLEALTDQVNVLLIYSTMKPGFCAGADLRELYYHYQKTGEGERVASVRKFLKRIHRVFNVIDALPQPTIAAVHGVTFGGGFELALTCDLIVADKTARFCFPELRLGLIPGFGGVPRLHRDLGNGLVRDLLLTGRSINASKALSIGLVSQLAAEGEALRLARTTAAQIQKFDRAAVAAAKRFIKPIPYHELSKEIEIFCDLFTQPAVMAGLQKFVKSTGRHPYLP